MGYVADRVDIAYLDAIDHEWRPARWSYCTFAEKASFFASHSYDRMVQDLYFEALTFKQSALLAFCVGLVVYANFTLCDLGARRLGQRLRERGLHQIIDPSVFWISPYLLLRAVLMDLEDPHPLTLSCSRKSREAVLNMHWRVGEIDYSTWGLKPVDQKGWI